MPIPCKLRRQCRAFVAFLAALVLFSTRAVHGEPTNALSDAEIQGRALTQKILEQRPVENSTNTGSLEIRDEKGRRLKLPMTCETVVTETNWLNRYLARLGTNDAGVTTLTVTHSGVEPNRYVLQEGQMIAGDDANRTMIPFAGSDFWLGDLGLEFLHWPQQTVLRKEFHRQCACTVLESTNPKPPAHGYSRVVCWIDEDSLGIVEAFAYDVNGKKLKNFYPKNFEKVHGQYQVESLVMENLQTGSRSVLEFDLDQ